MLYSGGTGTWQDLQKALTSIISTYNLDSDGADHPCLNGITLSWTLNTANARRSEVLEHDTCSTRNFLLINEVEMIEGIPASRLAGFDLPNEESGYSELCDSGYQVAGPEGWEPSVLPGIPS